MLRIAQFGLLIRTSARALFYLCRAWRLRIQKKPMAIKLPPVAATSPLSHNKIISFEPWLMEIVRLVVPSKRHRCYYRSFALAAVFRELGVPLTLNVGLSHIFNGGQVAGHCWLTLHGRIFKEKGDPQSSYPYMLGAGAEGVSYFVGD